MIKYDLFTYQISPITNAQTTIFGHNYSTEELIKNKNKFFSDIFEGLIFYSRRHKLNYKIVYKDSDFVLIRLANKKLIKVEKNFEKEYFNSEPSCLIGFYNDPKVQLIAIESDKTSFGNSFSVLKIIERAVDKRLNEYYLRFYPQPKYEEKQLWGILDEYSGRVEKLKFEFSKPNLARVNDSLTDELKEIGKSVNSATTKVEFEAPKDQVLENLSQANLQLAGLIKASSEGAGPAKVKISKARSWYTTENSVKTFEMEGIEIDADIETINNFINAFKNKLTNE